MPAQRSGAGKGADLSPRPSLLNPKALDYGGYMLLDVATNSVILGGSPIALGATAEEIDSYLNK